MLIDVWDSPVKLPFPLTYGFKAMLQRDIATPDMDVRYVSALSWYFLNLFGLNGLFKLMLGSENGERRCPSLISGTAAENLHLRSLRPSCGRLA
jgi:hypothetical protein